MLPICTVRLSVSAVLVLKVCKLSNADENVVLILARCLPHIVPNVLLNKREVSNDRSSEAVYIPRCTFSLSRGRTTKDCATKGREGDDSGVCLL